jgi:pilus assembly protein Flp/PilA
MPDDLFANFPKDYQMRSLIKHFYHDQRGATATEYALLVVFVALAIAVGANVLGTGLSGLFSQIGTLLSNITPVLPPLP